MKQTKANWARVLAAGVLAGFGLSAQASLVVPAGNSLVVNDTDLSITWTRDANLLKTMASTNPNLVNDIVAVMPIYDDPGYASIGIRPITLDTSQFNLTTGQMTWWAAQAWVGYLNKISYGGVTGWRLPNADPSCGGEYNCSNSELGRLFYTDLGGEAGSSITSTHNANFDLFGNVQSFEYWSGTEFAPVPTLAWIFVTQNGAQVYNQKYYPFFYGWAVRDGQVAAVPVPAAIWLMGSALAALGIFRRRKVAN